MKSPLLQPDGLDRSESYEEKNMVQPGTTHDQPVGQGAAKVKLTNAQRRFMRQIAAGWRYCNQDLRGPETAMGERLIARQMLCMERDDRHHEWFYAITPAGRAALSAESGS